MDDNVREIKVTEQEVRCMASNGSYNIANKQKYPFGSLLIQDNYKEKTGLCAWINRGSMQNGMVYKDFNPTIHCGSPTKILILKKR